MCTIFWGKGVRRRPPLDGVSPRVRGGMSMKDYPYPMQARNEALCPFTRDTQLSGFLTLPKSLLCWGLSPGALLVYGLLLDRGKLSQRSG